MHDETLFSWDRYGDFRNEFEELIADEDYNGFVDLYLSSKGYEIRHPEFLALETLARHGRVGWIERLSLDDEPFSKAFFWRARVAFKRFLERKPSLKNFRAFYSVYSRNSKNLFSKTGSRWYAQRRANVTVALLFSALQLDLVDIFIWVFRHENFAILSSQKYFFKTGWYGSGYQIFQSLLKTALLRNGNSEIALELLKRVPEFDLQGAYEDGDYTLFCYVLDNKFGKRVSFIREVLKLFPDISLESKCGTQEGDTTHQGDYLDFAEKKLRSPKIVSLLKSHKRHSRVDRMELSGFRRSEKFSQLSALRLDPSDLELRANCRPKKINWWSATPKSSLFLKLKDKKRLVRSYSVPSVAPSTMPASSYYQSNFKLEERFLYLKKDYSSPHDCGDAYRAQLRALERAQTESAVIDFDVSSAGAYQMKLLKAK